MKPINVYSTSQFPCQWEDLIIKNRQNTKKLIATIYTEKEAQKDNLGLGIKRERDGVYDIVVDALEINNEVVRNALKDLEKKTNQKYKFISKKTNEDKIIDYANKLMKYSKRFEDKNGNYNFNQAKISYEKILVIRSWIGELLYEAITCKNAETLKSLETIISFEIKELLKNKNGSSI